jgi:hypothetical protein
VLYLLCFHGSGFVDSQIAIQQQQRKASSTKSSEAKGPTDSKSSGSTGSESKPSRDKQGGGSGSTARRTNKTVTPSTKDTTTKLTITNAQVDSY